MRMNEKSSRQGKVNVTKILHQTTQPLTIPPFNFMHPNTNPSSQNTPSFASQQKYNKFKIIKGFQSN